MTNQTTKTCRDCGTEVPEGQLGHGCRSEYMKGGDGSRAGGGAGGTGGNERTGPPKCNCVGYPSSGHIPDCPCYSPTAAPKDSATQGEEPKTESCWCGRKESPATCSQKYNHDGRCPSCPGINGHQTDCPYWKPQGDPGEPPFYMPKDKTVRISPQEDGWEVDADYLRLKDRMQYEGSMAAVHGAGSYTGPTLPEVISKLLLRTESRVRGEMGGCPPHNLIDYHYEGGWGGSISPPNKKCTKCLLETRF